MIRLQRQEDKQAKGETQMYMQTGNLFGKFRMFAHLVHLYSMLPSFRTGPVFVQKDLYLIVFVGHLNLRQPKNSKSKRNISAINFRFCRAF